jgi:hypothetical protein
MNYEQFKERLIKSQEAVMLVAKYFEDHGYDVKVPKLVIAPHAVGAFSKYADNGDLFVSKGTRNLIVEVKHVSVKFEYAWPYHTMIVNSYTGYNSKEPKPDLHIILNRDSTHFASIRKETYEHWVLKRIYDKYKEADLLFYTIKADKAKFFKL